MPISAMLSAVLMSLLSPGPATTEIKCSECLPLMVSSKVHDVGPGQERRAILDAVREANADLNDVVAIVFLVEKLCSDGTHAYFRGRVRLRDGGGPVDAASWGECEQEPQDAVLEALLELKHGRWRAIKSNRCADDVLFSEEELKRYRILLRDE